MPSLRITTMLAAALLLTACSSTPSASTTSPAPTSASPATSLTPSAPAVSPSAANPSTGGTPVASAQDVVDRTGCTKFAPSADTAPFAASYGTCTWKGGRLQVYTFATADDEKQFFTAVKAYGVVPAQMAVVGLVVAAPADARNLTALRAALA